MSLYIYISDENLRNLAKQHLATKHRYTDSGFDILLPEQAVEFKPNEYLAQTVHTGAIVAALTESGNPAPCLLLPRSSISSNVLRLSNSIGLIDMGYRGEVMAKCDLVMSNTGHHQIECPLGMRIFQLVQHNFLPWKEIRIVDNLNELPPPPDNRGTGGFGSTGK